MQECMCVWVCARVCSCYSLIVSHPSISWYQMPKADSLWKDENQAPAVGINLPTAHNT